MINNLFSFWPAQRITKWLWQPADNPPVTTEKVNDLLTTGDWLLLGSVVSAFTRVVLTQLQENYQVSLEVPLISCMVSTVVLGVLGIVYSCGPSLVSEIASGMFSPSYIPRKPGDPGVYPVFKEGGDWQAIFIQKMKDNKDIIFSGWKEWMILLAKQHLEQPTFQSNLIFKNIDSFKADFSNKSDDQLAIAVEKLWEPYLEAIRTPDYLLSVEELQFMQGENPIPFVVPIQNPWTDCFMNAVLQVIMHDEVLQKALLVTYANAKENPQKTFLETIDAHSKGKMISTTELRPFMPEGKREGQQDSAEFLFRLSASLKQDEFPSLFFNHTITKYASRELENGVKEEKQLTKSNHELQCPLPLSDQTELLNGQELINAYFQLKDVEPHEWCDDENGNQKYMIRQEKIQIAGDRVVFSLSRFNSNNNRINTPVDMPEILTLNEQKYILQKIIRHHSSSTSWGHYTALLKINGRWIKANDTSISEETASGISDYRQNGYIYFYDKQPEMT